jgi:ATP-dependent RNA helicase DDX56/DBP9
VDKDKEASKRVKDRESGVARGIDFQFVANVINFDFPKVFYNYLSIFWQFSRSMTF